VNGKSRAAGEFYIRCRGLEYDRKEEFTHLNMSFGFDSLIMDKSN
jgi:hypothetical protein